MVQGGSVRYSAVSTISSVSGISTRISNDEAPSLVSAPPSAVAAGSSAAPPQAATSITRTRAMTGSLDLAADADLMLRPPRGMRCAWPRQGWHTPTREDQNDRSTCDSVYYA